jgi:hypothetical protein
MQITSTVVGALTSPAIRSATRRDERRFFVRMAYACAIIAFIGFTPTYWAPLATRSFDGPPLLHFHGLLSSAWFVLFIVQAQLAASGRLDRHRALGFAGISVATAMVFAGLLVAVNGLENRVAAGLEAQGRAFSIVPLSIVGCFAALVAAAIANVRRPEVHMRLMLAATIATLPPAIARLLFLIRFSDAVRPGLREPPSVAFALVSSFAADLLLVGAIVYDWRTRGRPHPAYVVAFAGLLAVQLGRVPLSGSAFWHAVTTWLLTFSG